jgi:hypothetical protein
MNLLSRVIYLICCKKTTARGVDKTAILWYNGGVVMGRGGLRGGLDKTAKV